LCHFRDAAEYLLQFTSAELTDLVDIVPKSNCAEKVID